MDIWAWIVVAGMALTVYIMVENRIERRRKTQLQNQVFASKIMCRSLSVDGVYHVLLSDGRRFESVQLLGLADDDADKLFLGHETMLVLRLSDGKQVWVRQSGVRCIMEA